MAPSKKKGMKKEKGESGADSRLQMRESSPVATSSQGVALDPQKKKKKKAKGSASKPNVRKEKKRGRPKKKVKRGEYSYYIHKILKQVHPDLEISLKGMLTMNSFVNDMFDRFAGEAAKLVKMGKTMTMTARDIQTSVRLQLSGQLATHAVSEGTKAVAKYMQSKGLDKGRY